ncbi:hypothetical protein AAVH_15060 [Aphelenchoides avenae]|nr:hypothetical protein AAVH_15060 [Aphelenchus avenae]
MHTKSRLYECSLCDFKTTWQTSLCGHNRNVHGHQTPNNRKRRSLTEPEEIGDTPKRSRLGALTRRTPVRSVECSPESVVSTDVEPDLACDGTVMQRSEYVVCKICDYVLESESSLESHQKHCRSDAIDFDSDCTRSSLAEKRDCSLIAIDAGESNSDDSSSMFYSLRFAINLSVLL